MTRPTTARLAGFMFLFYIVAGIAGIIFFSQASTGQGTAARLGSIAAHTPQMGLSFIFTLLTIFCALILGVTLYALTRDEDPELALLALTCRVIEGATNAVLAIALLALFTVAISTTTATSAEVAATGAIGGLLLQVQQWTTTVSATVFAVGSTLFSYLFLRARTIPVWLAWTGFLGSFLLVIAVPLAGLGIIQGTAARIVWLPMLVFELTLGFWLILRPALYPTAREGYER